MAEPIDDGQTYDDKVDERPGSKRQIGFTYRPLSTRQTYRYNHKRVRGTADEQLDADLAMLVEQIISWDRAGTVVSKATLEALHPQTLSGILAFVCGYVPRSKDSSEDAEKN
jgi:hypothetical protein